MNRLVRFREWLFSSDAEATTAAYTQCPAGGADECSCEDCQNYALFRVGIPDEVVHFFEQVGIDPQKESEVWRGGRTDNGRHQYFGWYHFKGQMLEGKDCRQPLPVGGSTLTLEPITPAFSVGFTESEAPTIFADKTNLVQIEFSTITPWGLGKETEPDW